MKPFLLGVIAAFVVLPSGTIAYFRLGLAEVRSDAKPPAWETQLCTPPYKRPSAEAPHGF